jgi:F420-dependent oxidoreductase-like protein
VLFSVCLDSRRPWEDLLRLTRHAEDAAFERVYLADHFMPYAPSASVPGEVYECWTTLSALAASTARIGLGTLVLGNTYRHPTVVANMAATLDRISGGRVLLGLGAGWQPNEHAAYGVELPAPGRRLDLFEEAVQVISMLLRSEVSNFEGVHYRLVEARCDPAPVQRPLPLLVGGSGERRTIPLAATYADAWHTWGAPSELRRKCGILDAACRAAGRAPTDVRRLTGQVLLVGAGRKPVDDDSDIIGDEVFVAERLRRYQAVQVDEFIVRDHAETPLADAVMSLTTLAMDVIPTLD